MQVSPTWMAAAAVFSSAVTLYTGWRLRCVLRDIAEKLK
jgi:hypothetical protein